MVDVVRLGVDAAGELLTLQRAAYLAEARAHHDLDLPPLTEPLDAVRAALAGGDGVRVFGVRDGSVDDSGESSQDSNGDTGRGRLVATVRLRPRVLGPLVAAVVQADPDEAALEIGRLAVVPDLQGRGLGTALLQHCADVAAAEGVAWLTLFTGERSAGNLTLYRRLGFVDTHCTPGGHDYELLHLARRSRVAGESDAESRRNVPGWLAPGPSGTAGCTP